MKVLKRITNSFLAIFAIIAIGLAGLFVLLDKIKYVILNILVIPALLFAFYGLVESQSLVITISYFILFNLIFYRDKYKGIIKSHIYYILSLTGLYIALLSFNYFGIIGLTFSDLLKLKINDINYTSLSFIGFLSSYLIGSFFKTKDVKKEKVVSNEYTPTQSVRLSGSKPKQKKTYTWEEKFKIWRVSLYTLSLIIFSTWVYLLTIA